MGTRSWCTAGSDGELTIVKLGHARRLIPRSLHPGQHRVLRRQHSAYSHPVSQCIGCALWRWASRQSSDGGNARVSGSCRAWTHHIFCLARHQPLHKLRLALRDLQGWQVDECHAMCLPASTFDNNSVGRRSFPTAPTLVHIALPQRQLLSGAPERWTPRWASWRMRVWLLAQCNRSRLWRVYFFTNKLGSCRRRAPGSWRQVERHAGRCRGS